MLQQLPTSRLSGSLVCANLLVLAGLAMSSSVAAAEPDKAFQSRVISEWRIGFLYHEDSRFKRAFVNQDQEKPREGSIFDINVEVLLAKSRRRYGSALVDFALRPRVSLGGSFNTGGGTSHVWAGLSWDYHLTESLFVELGQGIAFHDGHTGAGPSSGKRELGCSPLARQALNLGLDVAQNWRVMISVEHLDNFGLCAENAGLTNMGTRVGYRF